MAIAVGQSVVDISGKAIANLGYESVEHLAPIYSGDTIYSVSKILDKKLTSKGDTGIIFSEIQVTNQNNDIVMTLKRKTLVPLKNNKNYGGGYTRNKGISLAKNELIYILDSDDYVDASSLEKLFLSAINVKLFLGREYIFFIESDSNKLVSVIPFNFIFKIFSLDLAILIN